jgi:hypothetical protein
MSKKITLDSIVRSYLIERGENSKHNYARFLHLAIKGLEDLEFDVSAIPVFQEVAVGNNATVPIPSDSLKIIGVHFNAGGRWSSFARDNSLSIAVSDNCGVDSYAGVQNEYLSDWFGQLGIANSTYVTENSTRHWRNGEPMGGFFNNPEANAYLFRENDANGTIELSSNAPSKVIIEYMSYDKSLADGQYWVSPFLEEPIIAYINWTNIRSKPGSNKNLIDSMQKSYLAAKNKLDDRLTGMTKADFKQAVYFGITLTSQF